MVYRLYERSPGSTYFTMDQIKQANRENGYHFFDRKTMRFFRSKIATRRPINGQYFVTSEQFDANSPRLYTVRRANLMTGEVTTVNAFQAYSSLTAAKNACKAL